MKIITLHMGGGGSTVSTIPEWMRPYLETNLATAQENLKSGNFSNVAGFNPLQTQAQQAALTAANLQGNTALHSSAALDALGNIAAGKEIVPSSTGATDAIKKAAIYQAGVSSQPGIAAAAQRGTIGGARDLIKAGASQNDLAAKLAGIDYQDLQSRRQAAQSAAGTAIQSGGAVQDQLMAGANVMKGVGTDIQKQAQVEADAPFTGTQRFASLIHGTPWASNQQQQGKPQ